MVLGSYEKNCPRSDFSCITAIIIILQLTRVPGNWSLFENFDTKDGRLQVRKKKLKSLRE
jgi:hypothetical protein